MKYEVSSGAVVFTRKENNIYFVIVKSLDGYYGFPKGHIEGLETEEKAALRKVYEETMETFYFDSSKRILREVINFIK